MLTLINLPLINLYLNARKEITALGYCETNARQYKKLTNALFILTNQFT